MNNMTEEKQRLLAVLTDRMTTLQLDFTEPMWDTTDYMVSFNWSRIVEGEGRRTATLAIGSMDRVVGITSFNGRGSLFSVTTDGPVTPPSLTLDEAIEYIRHHIWADRS